MNFTENYSWYRTGLVSVIQGSKKITGMNTEWLTGNVKQGDVFTVGGNFFEIENIIGSEELSLTTPYSGSTAVNLEYAIIPRARAVLLAELALNIKNTITYWNNREKIYEAYDSRIAALENQSQTQTAVSPELQQKVNALETTLSDYASRITNLENQASSGTGSGTESSSAVTRFLGNLGLFIDSDGDLSQDDEHINASDYSDLNPGDVASEDDVDEMLNDVFN